LAGFDHFKAFRASAAMSAAVLAAAIVLALFVLASPALSGSTTLTVTKTADTNDGACDADCSLREAIVQANAFATDDIEVPAGIYKLTIKGRGEDLAATGDLDIRRGVAIRPKESGDKVIIDGNGIDRVFHTPILFPSTTVFTVSIFGVKITGGAIPDSVGGGILHTARGSTLNLTNSTVSGNSALQGGGINSGGGQGFGETVRIFRSTISGNVAPGGQGGGIQNTENLTLENATVSGNRSRFGGGIMQIGTARITDSTVAFNTAQQPGGGMYISIGNTTLKNTIVSNNASDFEKNCSRPVISEGNNLEKGTSCGFSEPGDKNADPRLGELASNGGPTRTHSLLKGSPAINAGGTPFPATDQRGISRPQGSANDVGAFEKKLRINVVQCPTGGSSTECVGTSAGDARIGRDDTYDNIKGAQGNDTYNGKGGCDALYDAGPTSSDLYLVTVEEFCNVGISALSIQDDGGEKDILDLSRFYESSDFAFSEAFIHLNMDGPGVNDITINNFFATDSIDVFRFSDKTLTAKQVKNSID
jgi:CSLREA domain-containing protein